MIHRHLKTLITNDYIYKEGTPPKVQYYARGGVELHLKTIDTTTIFTARNNGKVLTQAEKTYKPWFLEQFGTTYLETVKTSTTATY